MSAILIAVLAIIAFGFAFHPLFREESFVFAAEGGLDANLENLLSAREAAYSTIKDLESDHAQGKLSDADYQTLRAKYEAKAMVILQQLDQMEVATAANVKSISAAGGACAQCGEPFSNRDKFCRRCGAILALACGFCGAPIKANAKFCAGCGAPIAALQLA